MGGVIPVMLSRAPVTQLDQVFDMHNHAREKRDDRGRNTTLALSPLWGFFCSETS